MTDTTDPQPSADLCPNCQHPQHLPGTECDARIDHGPSRFHACLCLARPGAANACPPQMTCQGGTLGYSDIWYLQQGHSLSSADGVISPEVLKTAAPSAAVSPPPATDRAALAEDLRYVLGYRGPGHAHDRPGVWDTSGKPCEHCARLAVARENLAAYDADPDAVLSVLPPDGRAAVCICGHCEVVATELRRMADEEQQAETQARGPWTVDGRLKPHALPAATVPDQPSMTGGFGTSIEIPDLPPVDTGEEAREEVVHGCPPDGSGLTPCCGRTPFELPLTDRISSEVPVTCTTAPAVVAEPGKENDSPRTVCVCGHTRGEHLVVGGRLLCDECDPDSAENLVCKGFEAL